MDRKRVESRKRGIYGNKKGEGNECEKGLEKGKIDNNLREEKMRINRIIKEVRQNR